MDTHGLLLNMKKLIFESTLLEKKKKKMYIKQ